LIALFQPTYHSQGFCNNWGSSVPPRLPLNFIEYRNETLVNNLVLSFYTSMEYNTTRSKMLMPEYGRNVQRMVEYILTIEDRAKRLHYAEVIIELMGTLSPHLKLIEDYKHKLWDHLYQMTDFRLDVDAPYPPPTEEQLNAKPERLNYPQQEIKNKHLGHNLEALLHQGLEEETEEKRQAYAQAIGNYMKLAYTNWHKEPVHDDMIKNELLSLSNSKLQYESTGISRVRFDKNRHSKNASGHNANNNRSWNNNNSTPHPKNRKFKKNNG
jgi:hypothetical protein